MEVMVSGSGLRRKWQQNIKETLNMLELARDRVFQAGCNESDILQWTCYLMINDSMLKSYTTMLSL
uniref:Uncharacterized protein n=1 Tax=Arion vulgaris TaxID=1028688 RepID=A0A0B7B9D9_9EUPU